MKHQQNERTNNQLPFHQEGDHEEVAYDIRQTGVNFIGVGVNKNLDTRVLDEMIGQPEYVTYVDNIKLSTRYLAGQIYRQATELGE